MEKCDGKMDAGQLILRVTLIFGPSCQGIEKRSSSGSTSSTRKPSMEKKHTSPSEFTDTVWSLRWSLTRLAEPRLSWSVNPWPDWSKEQRCSPALSQSPTSGFSLLHGEAGVLENILPYQHDKPSTFTLTRWHLLLLSCKWLTTGLNYWNTSSSMRGRGNFHQWWSLSTSGRILIHKNSMAINQTFSVSWCCHRVRVTTTAHRASVASSNAHCENSKIEHYILKLTPIHWIHQNMN